MAVAVAHRQTVRALEVGARLPRSRSELRPAGQRQLPTTAAAGWAGCSRGAGSAAGSVAVMVEASAEG